MATSHPGDPLGRLLEGNVRFIHMRLERGNISSERRKELSAGQNPFAAIVTCSDSRVAPEIIFDQGLGDLFVVRVAGNVVNDMAIGSLEYACAHLKVPLILVLGHTKCGAVHVASTGVRADGHVKSILTALGPALRVAKTMPGDLVANATLVNVELTVKALTESKPILEPLVLSKKLKVVGGIYDISTGKVEFL